MLARRLAVQSAAVNAPSHGPVAVRSYPNGRLRPLPRGAVQLSSRFWTPVLDANRSVGLRHGWEMLQQSGNLEAFEIAAGRSRATPRGPLFRDSDLYKWLEAAAWEHGRRPDPELVALMDRGIALIVAAQLEDGYVNTYFQLEGAGRRWQDLRDGHELYCVGHLIQAAIAHFRATGSRSLLDPARRVADHVDARFRTGGVAGTPGHPEIETALVELWRTTDERRYLDLARTFVDARGRGLLGDTPWFFSGLDYYQDQIGVRQSRSMRGHAVRQLYLCAGVADVFLETHDQELWTALDAQWRDLCLTKLHVTGGIGARHRGESFGEPYELPNAQAYCETCAAIAAIQLGWRMLLTSGEGGIGDVIERILYNGFLSGVSRDGRHYFYVNPLASDGGIERPQWHGCACCPPNVMRLLASLDHYFATQSDDGVQIHQYGDLTLELDEIGLEMVADYPWDGHATIVVTRSAARPLRLSLRDPQGRTRSLTLDGAAVEVQRSDGYLHLERRFSAGERIDVDFGFDARAVVAHPRVDSCRGAVAVERGPLVYCLEQADVADGVDFHALRIDPRRPIAAKREPELLGGITTLEVEFDVADLAAWNGRLYANYGEIAGRTRSTSTARLVPYYSWANRGAGTMAVWLPVSG